MRPGGYPEYMRVVGTALTCIVAAFGAAFLVARAVVHQTPAKAATTQAVTPVAPRVAPVSRNHNAELVSEFAPMVSSLRHKPKPRPKRRRVTHHSAPAVSAAPASPTYTAPTYPPPAYTAPTYTPPATSNPSGTTTHKRSGGSGTTTIG